jgi:diguanylate cyclase (GGDEF)-like protein/PAS domain S-box-containing protein
MSLHESDLNDIHSAANGRLLLAFAWFAAAGVAGTVYLGPSDVRFQWLMGGVAFAVAVVFFLVPSLGPHLRRACAHDSSERRLRQLMLAVEQSPTSVLITDTRGYIEYVNPRFVALTGYSRDEAIGRKTSIVKSGLTPDAVYRDLWKTISSGRTWQGEFLNRKKNGDLYWEEAIMSPVTDEDGRIVSYIAVKTDVTQRKAIEQELRLSEERFRKLVMAGPDAVVGVDAAGKIVLANPESEKLLGYESGELVGKDVDCLVPLTSRESHGSHAARFLADPRSGTMARGQELTARRKDGSEVPVEINLSHSMTGEGPLVIAYMRDITERRGAERRLRDAYARLEEQMTENRSLQDSLREQAIRDPLTHLYNRRMLDEVLERELSLAARHAMPLGIVLLDLDHFKAINDNLGHAAGDECLVALATLLRHQFRDSDLVFRQGGDEFLVVLPGADAATAVKRAEEVRQMVVDLAIPHGARPVAFTLSVGVATYPVHGERADQLCRKADQALYASKRLGRNRVTAWSEEACAGATAAS